MYVFCTYMYCIILMCIVNIFAAINLPCHSLSLFLSPSFLLSAPPQTNPDDFPLPPTSSAPGGPVAVMTPHSGNVQFCSPPTDQPSQLTMQPNPAATGRTSGPGTPVHHNVSKGQYTVQYNLSYPGTSGPCSVLNLLLRIRGLCTTHTHYRRSGNVRR